MAYGLDNYTNITAPDSDYPDGRIKDNPGNNTGTPFNEQVYQDIHQVLAKFLRMASISPSGFHENEYTGFQYIEAMRKVLSRGNITYITGSAATNVVSPSLNPVIAYTPTALTGHFVSLDGSDDELNYGIVTVSNASPFTVNVVSTQGWPVNFSTSNYAVTAGTSKTFMLDRRTGPQWVVI